MITAVAVTLAACGGDGGGAAPTGTPGAPTTSDPSASEPAPPSTPTDDDGSPASPSSGVPEVDELAGYLATAADLGANWSLWEGFADWPDGTPGEIPEDQRGVLPTLPMCPNAGEEAVALAEGVGWQAFTQLHRETPDPFATMVVAQQLLLAGDPTEVADTFATLSDGLTACLTANLPGEWEIGLREALAVPGVGEDRYAERSFGVDPGGARRDTRLVLVRDGSVLMAILIDEVLISPEAESTLTADEVDGVVTAMAGRLP
jgi:hypothetical protein